MIARILSATPRSLYILVVELAGLAAIVAGIALWSVPAAFVAGGVGLVLEAYSLEKRAAE